MIAAAGGAGDIRTVLQTGLFGGLAGRRPYPARLIVSLRNPLLSLLVIHV